MFYFSVSDKSFLRKFLDLATRAFLTFISLKVGPKNCHTFCHTFQKILHRFGLFVILFVIHFLSYFLANWKSMTICMTICMTISRVQFWKSRSDQFPDAPQIPFSVLNKFDRLYVSDLGTHLHFRRRLPNNPDRVDLVPREVLDLSPLRLSEVEITHRLPSLLYFGCWSRTQTSRIPPPKCSNPQASNLAVHKNLWDPCHIAPAPDPSR